MTPDRIDYEHDGTINDLSVGPVATVRLERMAIDQYRLRLYRDGEPDVVLWIESAAVITVREGTP